MIYNVAMNSLLSRPRARILIFLLLLFNTGLAQSANIQFAEVKRYAMFSEASYHSVNSVKGIAKIYKFNVQHSGRIPDAKLDYFLLQHDQRPEQVIVIRGTANVENVVVDGAISLVEDERLKIVLHEGFAYSARAVLKEIAPFLNKNNSISVTGHSLGGAVAVILGMYLDHDGYSVERIYTFGQPKVTNIPGSVEFSHLNILRFVTPDDLVPLVPPLDPMDIKNIDIYWHLGKEVILYPGPQYSQIGVLSSMMRATKILSKRISEKNLMQHQMLHYLDAIENKLQSAKEVPFQSNIKMLDFLNF